MFHLEITTANAWFQGNAKERVAELLLGVADKLHQGAEDGYVYDGNGNKVGTWWLDHKDEEGDEE